MAEAARARAAPRHPGLPDEILIWEILLRLPPKPLLRCRAVCRAWRRATSTRDFLLAHHDRQPALPLLYDHSPWHNISFVDIIPLDHRAGVAAADKLQSVARIGSHNYMYHQHIRPTCMYPQASCDGLLILGSYTDSCISDVIQFSVCNPATREYAPLPLLSGFNLAGMYRHPPTGEYRLLLYPDLMLGGDDRPSGAEDACYVYALGSCQPPRHIGWPEVELLIHLIVPALFRGSLHWHIEEEEDWRGKMIMVFDITTELFREMHAPAVPDDANLFEIDGVLGMASFGDGIIDIWTMQDYDSEVWAFKYRVEVSVEQPTIEFGFGKYYSKLVVSSWGDDVLILVQSGERLLQFDIAGKLVSSFHRSFLSPTQCCLKQTLVQHTFFPTIQGYVVNTWPFISLDDSVVERLDFHLKVVQCDGAS